jgi:hypothetical protein
MSDGLPVPFALTAGLSGVLNTNHLIIVSGLAEITAGCISMGLGGFLAGQSEKGFNVSCVVTTLVLIAFGYLKAK